MLAEEKLPERDGEVRGKSAILQLERDILQFISPTIRSIIKKIELKKLETLEEIRLRADKPLMIHSGGSEWFVSQGGQLLTNRTGSFVVCQQEVIKSLELMCENSVYAYQEEIRNAFLTLRGGHRVGISGRAVLDGASMKFIKDVSSLNIRMSRQVKGCASKIIKYLISENREIYNTLIISPPQCGKTTLLRDISRLLGDGIDSLHFKGIKVGIIDERSEIAACYKGVPQNDIGCRSDVLDGCPKQVGMSMLLRSMSPEVIITDEIGNQGDYDAVMKVLNAGVKLITSAHGYNISEMKSREEVIRLIEKKIFERYVVLDNTKGPGNVKEIVDGQRMEVIYSDAS